jgi:N-methylhydantoinase B
MIRDPAMTALDLKSQIAANHVVRERMQRIYEGYGLDAVNDVSAGIIDQSARRFRARLRELPDGTWRARRYLDFPDEKYRMELALTKSDDVLTFDFTGTDGQVAFPINCQYLATKGAALAPLFPLVAWDLSWNEGIINCVNVIVPERSLLNCERPAPVSLNTVSTIHGANILSNAVLGKLLAASKYSERAVASWQGSFVVHTAGGIDRHGDYVVQVGGDVFGMAEGARPFADGAGPGGHIANVAQKMSNVEFEEQAFPKLFLYRRVVSDSGGAGMYRGGTAHEWALVPHGGGSDEITVVVSPGTGEEFPGAAGISGGYPGSTTVHRIVRDGREDAAVAAYAESAGAEDVRARSFTLRHRDVLYLRADGGGGYGDPLARSPELVAGDHRVRDVSRACAESVYGVVLTDSGDVDGLSTQRRRQAIRRERLGGSPRFAEGERASVPRTEKRISEYLQVASGPRGEFVQCTWCGARLCTPLERWKDHAVVRVSAISLAVRPLSASSQYVLRECFCPSCGTVLDVEAGCAEDDLLHDDVISWPSHKRVSA